MAMRLDETGLNRLARAIEFSRWRLQPFREHRMALLRQFVGAHYSYSGADTRVPLNLLQLAANIYVRQLVSKAPRAMATPQSAQYKPVAADWEAWMDKATVGMELEKHLRICALDGLFSIGIMMVGEAHAGDIDINGTTHFLGQPFAEPVDLDDWVHDVTGKRRDQVQFEANRYRVSLEEAKNNPLFDQETREKLTAQTRFAYNERGDPRTSTLSQSTMQLYDEYQDHVELWNVWLPKEKKVLVMPYQESVEGGFSGSKPLRVIDWQGPPRGPYATLSYADVPNNIMPAAPLQGMADLHELVNIMARKLGRQAERQKTVLGAMGSAADDAERFARANDGDIIRIDFPDRARELSSGGVKPENLATFLQFKELFVYMAGNLDALGGLSPQAATLGQDELLNKNSSAQVAEMQDRTIAFTRDIYERLGHWWWKNPLLTYSAQRNVNGIDIPVDIPPQMRQIPYDKLGLSIDPYSMQTSTPEKRLASIMQTLQTVIMPAQPAIAQQGGQIVWQQVLELLSKYGNMPELEYILKFGPPPEMQGPMQLADQALQGGPQQGQQQPPWMPAVTTRNTVRRSVPQMTSKGMSDVMSLMAMGGSNRQQNGMVGR